MQYDAITLDANVFFHTGISERWELIMKTIVDWAAMASRDVASFQRPIGAFPFPPHLAELGTHLRHAPLLHR